MRRIFKLMDRTVVDTILKMPEKQFFFRAISSWVGFRSTTVEFEVQERTEGVSKWSVKSLIRYAVTNITSFSSAPLQLVTLSGILFFLFALVLGIQTLVRFVTGGCAGRIYDRDHVTADHRKHPDGRDRDHRLLYCKDL